MKWAKKGQEQVPMTSRPTVRPATRPAPPPISAKPQCKDCGSTTKKLIYPGPRDLGCWRREIKARKARRRAARTEKVYGITGQERQEIIDFQGGGCICTDWTGYNGKTRALSVDHDHQTGAVRGVLCQHCNDLLGRVRDDPRYFERMAEYLRNPPAQRLLGERIVPEGG